MTRDIQKEVMCHKVQSMAVLQLLYLNIFGVWSLIVKSVACNISNTYSICPPVDFHLFSFHYSDR